CRHFVARRPSARGDRDGHGRRAGAAAAGRTHCRDVTRRDARDGDAPARPRARDHARHRRTRHERGDVDLRSRVRAAPGRGPRGGCAGRDPRQSRGPGGLSRWRRRRRRRGWPMLTLESVTAGYGDTTVLWDVSLEVRRGEAVALLGRNGMGKTTTLLATLGLNPARGGRIVFEGRDITRWRPFQIARLGIGYAPEGRRLF